MANDKKDEDKVEIRTLEDLIRVNLETLEGVVAGSIDNRKAGIIFTGSRTITGSLKLGLEAMKLGLPSIGGVEIGKLKQLPGPNGDPE